MEQAKEKQNQVQFDEYRKNPAQFGPYTTWIYKHDPRHIVFLMSRYKFVAKALQGKKRVLEVGCGDAFGLPVVAQVVGHVHAVDWEPLLMADNRKRLEHVKNCDFSVLDLVQGPFKETCDAAYLLDVIEHVDPKLEAEFMSNICKSLSKNAICVIGTPNIESEKHASPLSKEGHINLKSDQTMLKLLNTHFENTFLFSMNDEMVHTGYYKMAHYLMGVGVGLKA